MMSVSYFRIWPLPVAPGAAFPFSRPMSMMSMMDCSSCRRNSLAVVNDAVKGDLLQAVGHILSICDEPTDSQGGVRELQLPGFLPELPAYRASGAVVEQHLRPLVALRVGYGVLRLHLDVSALMPPDGLG